MACPCVYSWWFFLYLQVDQDTVIQYRPPGVIKQSSQSSYSILEKCLEAKEPYTPVFLGEQDFYRRMNGVQRHRFLEHLCLSFPIDMLRYSPGGNINVVFVWCVSEDRTESQMMTDAVRMTVSLKPKLSEYHSRQQRINFATSYSNLTKISPAIRRAMYADPTGDSTVSPNHKMDARLRLVLVGEPNILSPKDRRLKLSEYMNQWISLVDQICFQLTMNFIETVYVKTKLDCNSPMETPYYSCTSLPMPLICYYCAAPNAERDPKLLKS